jgi:putative tricarboxylic transport membrane protein
MAMAIMVPLTFYLPPWVSIPMLLAVTKASNFSSAIPAILIRTPGVSSAAAIVEDGYALRNQGKARKAIELSLFAGLVGDIFSDLVLIFLQCGRFASDHPNIWPLLFYH